MKLTPPVLLMNITLPNLHAHRVSEVVLASDLFQQSLEAFLPYFLPLVDPLGEGLAVPLPSQLLFIEL